MIRTLFFTTNVSEYKIVSGIIMTERKIYGVSFKKICRGVVFLEMMLSLAFVNVSLSSIRYRHNWYHSIMHCKLISIIPRQLSSKHPPSVRTQPLIRNILHCSLVQN